MGCNCTVCTDYIDTSKQEEVLRNVTRIIAEALLTKEMEDLGCEE